MESVKELKSQFIRHDILGAITLATVGVSIGLAINQLRHKPLPLVHESKESRMEMAVARLSTDAPTSHAEHIVPSTTITSDQLQIFLKEKRGFILDARPEIFYRLGHIPNALSLPRENFENAYRIFQADLERDRNQPIVVYCSNFVCEDAGLVQKSLRALGYSNVAVFAGGWSEWKEKGLPTAGEE
jgi:rhodanese-related sulfurtransferase